MLLPGPSLKSCSNVAKRIGKEREVAWVKDSIFLFGHSFLKEVSFSNFCLWPFHAELLWQEWLF